MKRWLFGLYIPFSAWSLATDNLTETKMPWFTGPLLAPNAHTVPPHHVNIEPYLFFLKSSKNYDERGHLVSHPAFYSLVQRTPMSFGLTSWMDLQITPQFLWQHTQGIKDAQPGDLPISLGFQLYQDTNERSWPGIKLSLRCTVPWGKYEDLNPIKLGTDGVGTGAWMPGMTCSLSRLLFLSPTHVLAPRLAIHYSMHEPISVQGSSVYGGSLDTQGTISGGNLFWVDLGIEYTLLYCKLYQIAIACDFFYQSIQKTSFTGKAMLPPGKPHQEQWSLAPAIEYNWNDHLGIIAGSWFTIKGRNSQSFAGFIAACNIFY